MSSKLPPGYLLTKSLMEEYEKIKKRSSFWVLGPNGWFHINNPILVKIKLEMLSDIINERWSNHE